MRTVEFFFDIGSPFSYLAATQLDALAQRTGATVRWRPFLLGGVFKATGNTAPAALPSRAAYLLKDLTRWGAHYGVPFHFPPWFPANMLQTQRVLVAIELDAGEAAMKQAALRLFGAFWGGECDVTAPGNLSPLLDACGLDGAALVARAADADVKRALIEATEDAVRRGAFGAPTFFVGEEMFFGNDRLSFVEAALG